MTDDHLALLELDIPHLDALTKRIIALVPDDPAVYDKWLHDPEKSQEIGALKGFYTKCHIELEADYADKVSEEKRRLKIGGMKPMNALDEAKHTYRNLFMLVAAADSLRESFTQKYWTLVQDGVIRRD